MEFLVICDGEYDKRLDNFKINIEVMGTRYEGRTESIEKVQQDDKIKIVR